MGSRNAAGAYAARGIGWMLRAHYDGLIREPLPDKWVELINCLDEKERARLKSELSLPPDDGEPPLKC